MEQKRKEAHSFGDSTYMSVRDRMELKEQKRQIKNNVWKILIWGKDYQENPKIISFSGFYFYWQLTRNAL